MKRMRSEIVAGTFSTFYGTHKDTLAVSDAEFPSTPPKVKRKSTKRARGDYEVHQGEGFFAIKQISSGEVMHSVSNPTEEAKALYIQQTRFSHRVKENPQSPFVVWDVGLGAATNAMAAINEYEALVLGANLQNDAISTLHIISFENDLDSLALTLKNPGLFVHARHPGPYALLKEGKWRSIDGKITWELRRGDFLTELGTLGNLPAPDLIFYDPFSYKTNPSLWTYEIFRQLHEHSRTDRTALITYSASTAIRAGLLAAGFRVALGAGSGPKESTTVATCGRRKEFEGKYLTLAWMERWNRSDNKYPPHLREGEYSHFQQKLMQAFQ
jgi:queuine tRNA-ribosyltransferase